MLQANGREASEEAVGVSPARRVTTAGLTALALGSFVAITGAIAYPGNHAAIAGPGSGGLQSPGPLFRRTRRARTRSARTLPTARDPRGVVREMRPRARRHRGNTTVPWTRMGRWGRTREQKFSVIEHSLP